ncbi:MAG: pitrilysin family protein [Longimicrobiales bacterium]|nr:pitrilysin family protein [Longimicrobiales bacterium]
MPHHRARPTLLALFALLTGLGPAGEAVAQRTVERSPELEAVARVEGITEYRLDNGLRVLLFPDASRQQITVNITYLVGSRHEGYGETGMAHLLEHLLFQGSENHPDITQELSERGANPNGTTGRDRTNYFEIFPASEENLAWALDLEADRMVNSFVAAADLSSEMTVVRNEMEMGENNPLGMLVERVLSTAYLWHNYGNSTIGARADVENVPIERLQAFYRKYYQPDNAILVVAGNFDEALARELVVEKFGDIPRPERTGANVLWETYTDEPTQDGERNVELRRVGETPIAVSAYHVPPGSHPDFAAVDALAFILGDQPSGRLYQSLVEAGLAARTSAMAFQFREASPLLAYATLPPEGDLDAAVQAMNETVLGVLSRPVTDEEVERAKTSLLNDIRQAFNSSASIALQLSEWAAMGDWRLFFLHRDRIEALTAEDVNRVAQAYLKPSNRTVGRFVPTAQPDRAQIPDLPDIAAMVEGYTGRETVAEGEAFDPSPENIDARTRTFTLSNGLEVALLPKETRGDQATLRVRLHFGDETSLTALGTAGGMAGAMIMRGTETRTRQEIQDELDRLQAQGSIGGGPTIATGQFRTVREHVPDLLRLVADILRNPSFPETEFDVMREQRITSVEQSSTEPQPLATIELGRHMEPWEEGHPRYTETIEEALAALESATLEEARAFYESFWGPQAGNIVLVGDFDEAEVRRVLEDELGDWRSPHPYRRIATPFHDPDPIDVEIETPDKANAFLYAQQNLPLRDTDPDYPAMLIAGEMIGGGILNSRLARRIRDQEGLSYAVQAVVSGHPVDPAGRFVAVAIFAPENKDRVESALFEELQKVLDEGFEEDEFQRARQGWLENRRLGRAQDGNLAGSLAEKLYFDRTFHFDAEIEDRVRDLTLEDVNRAVRAYLDPTRLSVAKAGDFANSGSPGA